MTMILYLLPRNSPVFLHSKSSVIPNLPPCSSSRSSSGHHEQPDNHSGQGHQSRGRRPERRGPCNHFISNSPPQYPMQILPEDHAETARAVLEAAHVGELLEVLVVAVVVDRHLALLFNLVEDTAGVESCGGLDVLGVDVADGDLGGRGGDAGREDAREGEDGEAHLVVFVVGFVVCECVIV